MPKQANGHALKGNASTASPQYIITVSVDAIAKKHGEGGRLKDHYFLSCCAIFGRLRGDKVTAIEAKWFSDKREFWKWLISKTSTQHTTWVVSHEILHELILLDFTALFTEGELVTDSPRKKRKKPGDNSTDTEFDGLCIIESPPTIIGAKASDTQGRIVFCDSSNWFPIDLDSTSDRIIDHSILTQPIKFPDLTYCHQSGRQARIVFAAFVELVRWVKLNDLGMFRYTSAGQANSAYRHRFMGRKIYIHNNSEIKLLERRSYFGGRTEVFKIGRFSEKMAKLDVNSLFPSVMARNHFPYLLDQYELYSEYRPDWPDIDWSACVADVELYTNEPTFPLRYKSRTWYPIGRCYTTLCGPELAYAIKRKYVVAMRTWAIYKLDRLFDKWVAALWNMRNGYKLSGDALYEQFVKRLMNSLYGKFAQMSQRWEKTSDSVILLPWTQHTDYDFETGQANVYRSFGWTVQKQAERKEISNSFPAIAAFVTAYARRRMDYLRYVAGNRNVYYQGIDSLIVTLDGLSNLQAAKEVSQHELGKLRLEGITDGGQILGTSDYRFGEVTRIAGPNRGGSAEYESGIMSRTISAKSKLFAGESQDFLHERNIDWNRRSNTWGRRADQDGWIRPAIFSSKSESDGTFTNGEFTRPSAIAVTAASQSVNEPLGNLEDASRTASTASDG